MSQPRIVWLLYEIGLEHHVPLLLEFKRVFPDVVFLSSRWDSVHWNRLPDGVRGSGGYPEELGVKFVGRSGWIRLGRGPGQYERGIVVLSPAIILELLRIRPQVI